MQTTTNDIFKRLATGDRYRRFFSLMEVMGFDTLTVNYSGGGDSGGPDNYTFHPDAKPSTAKKIEEYFEEFLCEPIWNHHGSFADGGGFSVDGEVVWDAKEKTVSISGCNHYYEYDEEGEDSGQVDEEWGETVNSIDDDYDDSQEEDNFECVAFYSIHILEKQLPPEHHNRMIAAAITGDVGAIKYVKWCEQNK